MNLNNFISKDLTPNQLLLEESIIGMELMRSSPKDLIEVIRMYRGQICGACLNEAQMATARRRLAIVRKMLIRLG